MPLEFPLAQKLSQFNNIGQSVMLLLHIQLQRAKFSPILF